MIESRIRSMDTLGMVPAPDGRTHVNVPAMLAVRGMGGDLYRPCVMYHTRSSVHHRQAFCDECRDWLRNRLDPGTWSWSSD